MITLIKKKVGEKCNTEMVMIQVIWLYYKSVKNKMH